jgi:hypothetical protein
MPYFTIDQIKADNERWFSPDTMAFFNSEITPGVWPVEGGAYFVTSEQPHVYEGEQEPRRWTVRFARDGGQYIATVGGFRAHATLGDALDMTYELAGSPGPHPCEVPEGPDTPA